MMQYLNWPLIIAVLALALALLVFLARRNKRDKKELLPPDTTEDAVSEARKEQERRDNSL